MTSNQNTPRTTGSKLFEYETDEQEAARLARSTGDHAALARLEVTNPRVEVGQLLELPVRHGVRAVVVVTGIAPRELKLGRVNQHDNWYATLMVASNGTGEHYRTGVHHQLSESELRRARPVEPTMLLTTDPAQEMVFQDR